MTLTDRLASLAVAHLGDDEADAIRTLSLTNIAAGIGNRGTIDQVIRQLPSQIATEPGSVAYVLATMLHARTQDDFYPEGRVHVGAIALASTLALAPSVGNRTLPCLAAGYRVMCGISRTYSPDAQRSGFRPSGLFGPMGAAASAAVALDLGPEGVANAIGLAAAMSGGTNQAWISGSDEWLMQVGVAARCGVEAALFTRAGIRASEMAIEGSAGWAAAFFADSHGSRLIDHLDRGSPDATLVAIKPYPVSGIAQIHTSLACEISDVLHGTVPTRIIVRISEIEAKYPGSSNRGPFQSRSDALMSVAFCVACGLLDGTVSLERLEGPNAPDIRIYISRIELLPEASIEENEARIEVHYGDGLFVERTGRAADILYPRWSELQRDVEALAKRTESDLTSVKAVRDSLKAPQIEAAELLVNFALSDR